MFRREDAQSTLLLWSSFEQNKLLWLSTLPTVPRFDAATASVEEELSTNRGKSRFHDHKSLIRENRTNRVRHGRASIDHYQGKSQIAPTALTMLLENVAAGAS